eukprot:3758265-Lingulodinium_polyedra.AAC.1
MGPDKRRRHPQGGHPRQCNAHRAAFSHRRIKGHTDASRLNQKKATACCVTDALKQQAGRQRRRNNNSHDRSQPITVPCSTEAASTMPTVGLTPSHAS